MSAASATAPEGDRSACVAILDAGSQYGKVIDRRIREASVESDILPFDTPLETLRRYGAVVISGGPQSVYGDAAPKYDPRLFEEGALGRPLLGICYGLQLVNTVYGGAVGETGSREDGQLPVRVTSDASRLFKGLPREQEVLLTHGDSVTRVADGFTVAAESAHCIAAIEDDKRRVYAVQFHPEVDLTTHGVAILRNFLFGVAGLPGSFTIANRLETAVNYIRGVVGDNDVLCLVSGGVDSTVVARLLLRALPAERVHAVHVDHGFMRAGESEMVMAALAAAGLEVKLVSAADEFAGARTTIDGVETPRLRDALEPETVRKIIGDAFMAVTDRAVRDLGLDPDRVILAQGTLRPDLIESGSDHVSSAADTIKSHHNDTALVRVLRRAGRVVEPLQEYHKDSARRLGEELGLPEALVWRQPFPGPGLAIRILCAEDEYTAGDDDAKLAALARATEAHPGVHATLLPCKTVGVQGDGRTYSSLVGLSTDGEPNWAELVELAKAVPRVARGVNRVVYVCGEAVLEPRLHGVTPTRLTPDVVEQSRAADAAVREVLSRHGLNRSISQVPVVLFPADFGTPGARAVGIRPFVTNDFMTGLPAVPGRDIPAAAVREMVDAVLAVPGVVRVCFDLTGKPPGTTEWL